MSFLVGLVVGVVLGCVVLIGMCALGSEAAESDAEQEWKREGRS